jgi:hypothetical protein
MVKKIRLIDDDQEPNTDPAILQFQKDMLAHQQAIDWKLWELLKITKLWAAREGLIEEVTVEVPPEVRHPVENPIIVDEDEE